MGYEVRFFRVDVFSPVGIDWGVVCSIPVGLVEWADYVIVPGGARLGGEGCWFRGKVVRGPWSLYALPDFLRFVDPSYFSLEYPAEYSVGPVLGRIVEYALGEVRRSAEYAWCVNGLCVPMRPPPVLVFSEVYYGGVELRASEGADLVIISPGEGVEPPRGLPYGVDSWDTGRLVEWLDSGAVLGMSLTRDKLASIPVRLREEKAFVLVPSKLGSAWDRVQDLIASYREAVSMGYTRLILDPVIQPLNAPGALEGLIAARLLSESVRAPLMLGINNVYELLDADTYGSIPLLTGLAAEAGVSIVLVSEESRKAWGATLEARIAADMVSLAYRWRSPPKNLGLSLLVSKEKGLAAW